MRRAKIVCTLGPATAGPAAMEELVRAGMDVARLNLSHGSHSEHQSAILDVRAASQVTGRNVGILADLQGPKIRVGTFPSGPVELVAGDRFVITTDQVDGDYSRCSTTFVGLPADVRVGDPVLIDDGRIVLIVKEVSGNDVTTEVVEGGPVSDHKGINLPGTVVSVPALTDKDIEDLKFALAVGADMIALSFVRSASDIEAVHAVMDEAGVRLPVLAKVEKPEAVENLAQIIAAFDGVMVARGDLGVELPLEQVPHVQKMAIDMCRQAAKPVIVATQMLDSMITAIRPTRAEVSDVANAVLDGADALMLSGETSVGGHPTLVVETMARIIVEVESHEDAIKPLHRDQHEHDIALAVTQAACEVGEAVRATHLCAFTEFGTSMRKLARHRPRMTLVAFTPNARARSELALLWGVEAFLIRRASSTDEMVEIVDAELTRLERCQPGDRVVVIAGVPPGVKGTTNGMRVHIIGTHERDRLG
ncbi:MAG: pyruvate kinase [Actinomycetes bacterium]